MNKIISVAMTVFFGFALAILVNQIFAPFTVKVPFNALWDFPIVGPSLFLLGIGEYIGFADLAVILLMFGLAIEEAE